MNRSGVLVGGLGALLVFSVGTGLLAHTAGQAAGTRVVCVDVVKIFNEYQRQKDLSEEMRDLQNALQLESDERKRRIDTQQAALDVLNQNDPTYVGKLREMFKIQIEYKNWFELKQAEMTREIAVWSARVYTEILNAVEQIAVQDGYDAVLYRDEFDPVMTDPDAIREQIRGRKVLYCNPGSDITDIVLKKLNDDYRALPRTRMLDVP